MDPIYLDYVGNGIWALSHDKAFPYPRIEVCGNPIRLLQEFMELGWLIELSDAAAYICDNILADVGWNEQYSRMVKYPHPECSNN